MGKSTISMVIFNSYVSLPEGNCPPLLLDVPLKMLEIHRKHAIFGGKPMGFIHLLLWICQRVPSTPLEGGLFLLLFVGF